MFEELRKFDLDQHDFPTLMDNVSALLRTLTLNIDSRHTKRIPFIFYLFMLIGLVSYVYAFQISVWWFIFFRGVEGELLKKVIAFSQMITSMVSFTKFLHMYWNKNNLKIIMDAYLLCDSAVAPGSRMSRKINMTLRAVKKRALILWVVIVVEYVLYTMVRPHGRLEPIGATPNFEISMTIIALTAPVTVFGPINITVLLIVIAGYSEAYMLALAEELLCLWNDSETDYQTSDKESTHNVSIDDFVQRRLENIMKSHAQNIQMNQLVEDVFRNGIAFQLMLLSVSLVADLLGGLQNTYLQMPFTLMLVGMDCFTGQNLLDASLAFEAAVYHCKWEKFGKNNMKSVLLMLQSAQRSLKLSAGGVASLSYPCFFYIIKRIYSVYAALQSKDSTTGGSREFSMM